MAKLTKFLAWAIEWIKKVSTNIGIIRKTDLGQRPGVFSSMCEEKEIFVKYPRRYIKQEIGYLNKDLG